jgi:prephenate dehydrogenase
MKIGKLVVVGVGLIGGSFALALKRAEAVGSVIGVGRGEANLRRALELGVIDAIGALDRATLGDADLVLVATPVGQMGAVFRALAPLLGPGTVATDAGSTKQDVVALARKELGAAFARFVPGHPVAGTEKSGAEAAFADLYRGRKVVLTPLPETEKRAADRVREAWRHCGAEVLDLDPARHDAILATVSHLPHVLAYALVDRVATDPQAGQLFGLAAGGFRDFTRLASSHPEMWRDICLANRDAILREIDRYGSELSAVRDMIAHGDPRAIEALFAGARDARNRWIHSHQEPPPAPRRKS